MPSLSAAARAMIADALAAAPHGRRTAVADQLATTLGISRSTVYRAAGRRGRARARPPGRPEYREWTPIAVAWAHRAPKPVPLDLAIEAAVEAGDLPPAAVRMPVQTAYRVAREMGLAPRRRRTHTLSADWPMQALLVDASTSEHLVVVRALGGGDHLLRLHRRPAPRRAGGYKNKPLGPDRLRVHVCGIWDMCTGYVLSRYHVATGETALDVLDFLCWALSAGHGDPRIPLQGVPDDLWSDLGPLAKSRMALDLLDRIDTTLVTGEPYAKERMGGVERQHRTRWARFERALFLRGGTEITLSGLNDRLREYEVRENARRPSRTPVGGRPASRTDAWTALTRGRPADHPLRALPADPLRTLTRAEPKWVDRSGIVRWAGVEYEAETWSERWVMARQAADGSGDIVIEDQATRERQVARRWVPRPYGEIRGVPASPLDRLLDTAPATGGADVYAPRPDAGAGAGNVSALPARVAPAAPLYDPLDAARCRDVEEAMRLFVSLWPHPLSDALHQEVVRHVEAAGLDRRAVVELAQSLIREVSA